MGRIFALIGRSGTGKSTIEKQLEKLGYTRIISNTTRNIRENEQQDIDYHYISDNDFDQLEKKNQLIEHTKYNNWRYGISYDNISNLDKQDYICVIEPYGFKQIQNILGDKIVPILIYATPYERLCRSILRQPNSNDAAYKEICRRFLGDYDTFDLFEKYKQYKYKIHNINIDKSVQIIDKIIKYEDELELLKLPDIPLGSMVKIIKIKHKDEGKHLIKYIGHCFPILSYIQPNSRKEKRYKCLINNETNETAYFRRSELEIIK